MNLLEFGARRTVAVVVYDRLAVFEVAVPCAVCGIARSAMGAPTDGLLLCAADPPPLRTSEGGFTVDTPHDLSHLPQADTLIMPAWRDVHETPPDHLLDALRAAYERGTRIASLCSGAFVLAHAELLDVQAMASHAHLSTRTFARQFLAMTGTSPLRWLLVQRVAAAQRLLETADLTVDHVAQACGLGTAANLRLHFGRVVGTSPTAYRKAFRQR